MPIYNFFKNLFGIPDNSDNSENFGNERPYSHFSEDRRNNIWDENEEDDRDMPDQNGPFQGFSMFVDPVEIHRYFEQQMDDMLRSFQGFLNFDNSPSDFGGFPPFNDKSSQTEPAKENLRDHYLKPGYEHARNGQTEKPPDSDLDGKIDIGNLDSIIGNKSSSKQQITPFKPNATPHTRYFGQSITSRRVQRPDGSIEVHKTVRDHEGNEENTITRQMGDKQYTVTTRKNKDGKEEKIEDIVNLEEKDIDQFINIWQSNQPQDDPNKHFPFDKFFK